MTKAELIEELAVRAEVPKARVQRVIEALCEVIAERVSAGETVALPPLGRFSHVRRAERKARNLQTGETVTVPERVAVRFKVSEALKRRLNH
ncbi:MAG: HU family DNA-binding protein [Alicyclobacillus sp.]|nr:HU family DNA-binding protein [Alicyclobacillus sp.]